MEPSVAEVEAFANVDDVLKLAGFGAAPEGGDELVSARGSLLRLLRLAASDHFRIVGNMPEARLTAAVESWKVGEQSDLRGDYPGSLFWQGMQDCLQPR